MKSKGYTIENNIFINSKAIVDLLNDFENLEIEYIENYFNTKCYINYNNNLWCISFDNNQCINIIEKTIICYNVWNSFKNRTVIRINPKIANDVLNKFNNFNNSNNVKIFRSFCNSTIIYIMSDNKKHILNSINFIMDQINKYNNNMHFLTINIKLSYFLDMLKYFLPSNINFEKNIIIKRSNFNNMLNINNDKKNYRICLIFQSEDYIIWNSVKKILSNIQIDIFKKIEYLNVDKKYNKEKLNIKRYKLITRTIDENKFQIPIYKKTMDIYSSSI